MATRPNFKVGQKNVTAAGTGEQLPDLKVGEDQYLVIKAKRTNTGLIKIGETKAIAEGTANFTLEANEVVRLRIDNASKVWIDASMSGEGVELILEA